MLPTVGQEFPRAGPELLWVESPLAFGNKWDPEYRRRWMRIWRQEPEKIEL